MKAKSVNQFIKTTILFLGVNCGWVIYKAATLPHAQLLAELGGR